MLLQLEIDNYNGVKNFGNYKNNKIKLLMWSKYLSSVILEWKYFIPPKKNSFYFEIIS